jgi:hypothetical protein
MSVEGHMPLTDGGVSSAERAATCPMPSGNNQG